MLRKQKLGTKWFILETAGQFKRTKFEPSCSTSIHFGMLDVQSLDEAGIFRYLVTINGKQKIFFISYNLIDLKICERS